MSSSMSLVSFVLPSPPPPGSSALNPQLCHNAGPSKRVLRVSCNASESITVVENKQTHRRCECFDLYKELVPYVNAWSWQKAMVEKRHALMDKGEDLSDSLIVLQHAPVYTLGTRSLEEYLKFDLRDAPYDVYRTERGGEVTYHGPGQLVMYPILNLRHHKMDLHWYLRSLEEVVIRVLSTTFSIKASRLEGLTGVWVGNQKIAAIGIRVSRWVTYHGLALNVTMDLTPFRFIVPCGIQDREVGSILGLLGEAACAKDNGHSVLMNAAHESILKEFSEVFQLSLETVSISGLDSLKSKSLGLLDCLPNSDPVRGT